MIKYPSHLKLASWGLKTQLAAIVVGAVLAMGMLMPALASTPRAAYHMSYNGTILQVRLKNGKWATHPAPKDSKWVMTDTGPILMDVPWTTQDNSFMIAANITGQGVAPLTYDSSGNLLVNMAVGSVSVTFPFAGNADAQAGTASGQATGLMGWNGATWDRLQVDGSKNLKTFVSNAVTIAAPLPGNSNTATGANQSIGVQAVNGANMVPLKADASNNLNVNIAASAGAVNSAQGGSGAITPTVGDTTVAINISTAVTTQIIALSGSKLIYITSIMLWANGGDTVTLEYGTGSLCATGLTTLTGPIVMAAQSAFSADALNGTIIVPAPGAAGQAFCIVTTQAVQLSGWITYAQHT